MDHNLFFHFERALAEHSKGASYHSLVHAKKLYFSITGPAHEEDEDYESRMNSFNEWFLFNFKEEESQSLKMEEYLKKYPVEDEIKEGLGQVNFSLFEYSGESWFKNRIIKDILHNKKITLSLKGTLPGLLKDDLFIGRVLTHKKEHFLTSGISVLPRSMKKIFQKEAKKVRKIGNSDLEEKFLLQIESMNNKCKRYGHLDPKNVFDFGPVHQFQEELKAV